MKSSIILKVTCIKATSLAYGWKFHTETVKKSHGDNGTLTLSWPDGLTSRKTETWLDESVMIWHGPRWPLKDAPCHLTALRGEMPTQHLALTQQNDVGLQSNIKVALKWKQFDIAREENEEMRLMLWGEWVGGLMRKRKSVEVEKLHSWCFMLKWHSGFDTISERLLFFSVRPDPSLNSREGEVRGLFSCKKQQGKRGVLFKDIQHIKCFFAAKKNDLLHGFKESLAVVHEGHDELQLSASRLHRCWRETDNTAFNNRTTETKVNYIFLEKRALVMGLRTFVLQQTFPPEWIYSHTKNVQLDI